MNKLILIVLCIITSISVAVSAILVHKLYLVSLTLENSINTDVYSLYMHINDLGNMADHENNSTLQSAINLCNSLDKEFEIGNRISNKYMYIQDLVFAYNTMLNAVYNEKDYSVNDFNKTFAALNEYLYIFISVDKDFKSCLSEFNNNINADINKFYSICVNAHNFNYSNKQ